MEIEEIDLKSSGDKRADSQLLEARGLEPTKEYPNPITKSSTM